MLILIKIRRQTKPNQTLIRNAAGPQIPQSDLLHTDTATTKGDGGAREGRRKGEEEKTKYTTKETQSGAEFIN